MYVSKKKVGFLEEFMIQGVVVGEDESEWRCYEEG